jgi:hypothetical protein
MYEILLYWTDMKQNCGCFHNVEFIFPNTSFNRCLVFVQAVGFLTYVLEVVGMNLFRTKGIHT